MNDNCTMGLVINDITVVNDFQWNIFLMLSFFLLLFLLLFSKFNISFLLFLRYCWYFGGCLNTGVVSPLHNWSSTVNLQPFVFQIIDHLEREALCIEGILRIPGQVVRVKVCVT